MKIIHKMPTWIISAVIAAALTSGGTYAYNAATVSGQVNVEEPVAIVGGSTFTFDLYPGEFDTLDLDIANSSSSQMTVYPTAIITPDPGQDVCVELPQSITLDANQTVSISADVFATLSAAPGSYSVELILQR